MSTEGIENLQQVSGNPEGRAHVYGCELVQGCMHAQDRPEKTLSSQL